MGLFFSGFYWLIQGFLLMPVKHVGENMNRYTTTKSKILNRTEQTAKLTNIMMYMGSGLDINADMMMIGMTGYVAI